MTLLSFPREIGLRRNLCNNREDFNRYISTLNGKASCYTSLYSFNRTDPIKPWKTDPDSVVIDRAWWDFDTTSDTTMDDVRKDVHTLISRLSGDIRVVATGRGFHVHELFAEPVLGLAIAKHIDRYERKMGRNLKTLDGVGHPQKLTRIPDTFNPTRGRWAVNIDVEAFMEDYLGYEIPTLPSPTLLSRDPFRGEPVTEGLNIVNWIANNPVQQHQFSPVKELEVGDALNVPLPNCLEKAIKTSNPRHEIRVALVQHLSEHLRLFSPLDSVSRENREEIVSQISEYIGTLNWRDYVPNITNTQVRHIVNRYDHSPSPHWYMSRGYCDGSCWFCGGFR
tara:strand:+ start:19918 stop:20928 length:1011 start_codon:yes stop_codon:yes gene_type:complete